MPRRADTAKMKMAKGETRPSRAVVELYPDHASRPDPDVIDPPKWLSRAAKPIFREKVERYRQRGQKVGGFEGSLAQYCALEAELIALRRKGMTPTMAMVSAHRYWSTEFYDTPASQRIGATAAGLKENRFARNGRRA